MKSDFIAIASHELRTPLGLIIGHATFLQENTNNEQTLKQLDVIIRSATRLKEIVEQMSSLNIHQIGKSRIRRAPVSVSQLIQEVTQSFAESARQKKIALIVDAPPSDLYVEADIEKISLALGNLIDNALTFTNEHGHIWVKAEKLPGHIKVSVIDDGIGIPAKDLHRVFDRFFQVESHATRRHGGMGLGLAVAKVMIELHGGQIWVESVEGKGSNFSFILPAVDHYSNEK
jgi:two-component system sensor histidine kinase VicK